MEKERLWRGTLEPTRVSSLIRTWLEEDVPCFDVGGAVVGDDVVVAELWVKSEGVLAGKPWFEAVFAAELGCEVRWEPNVWEGMKVGGSGPQRLATVSGRARMVLIGERTALNTLARCSGVATRAAEVVDVVRTREWKGSVAGTRKTTPGFRLVEKYGMIVGGADPHRMNLSSMVMLKDNHIACSHGVGAAIQSARSLAGFSMKVEVECGTVEEALQAARDGADVVMLDNFDPPRFREAAERVKREYPSVLIEGSGGISIASIADYCCPAADILSLSLGQGYSTVDYSLKVNTALKPTD